MEGGIYDLTSEVKKNLEDIKMQNGIVVIFCIGSTCSISTMEFESGLQEDLPQALDRVAPKNIPYAHHETWHDDNGRSHVKSTIVGPSLTVPIVNGELTLGTWQQVIFIEWDTRGRDRKVVLQFLGD